MFQIIFIITLCILTSHRVELVRVTVEQGVLEGKVLESSTGRGHYHSFKGIPYAAPPLGKLRFKAPVPPLEWKGIRNASQHGPICVQYEYTNDQVTGSEDCLYLNVYSPSLKPRTLLPVMFYIHEGYFILGSGNSDKYAPDFLMGYGVVLVTINYRLDSLGFISVDTDAVPGNAGMKDQIAALKWVQMNIKQFGGDPKRVTIFGASAGGASVTLHLLSPAATGLFHGAIAMSGSLFNDWAISFEHRKRAFILGKKLGINTTNPDDLIEFLQSMPVEKLVTVRPNIQTFDEVLYNLRSLIYFTPIVEKVNSEQQYLVEYPRELLRQGRVNKVNFMAGHTENEGLIVTFRRIDAILTNYDQFKQLYVPTKISKKISPEKVYYLADQIRERYIRNITILASIEGFLTYISYSQFVYDIHNFFERYARVNSMKRYFYLFAIYSSRNFFFRKAWKFSIRQSTHLDDTPYLFDGCNNNMKVNVRSKVFKYIDKMCRLFTNFAKYGNPTPDNTFGIHWPSYDHNKSYVSIGDKLTVRHEHSKELDFWERIYNEVDVVPYIN